MCVQRKVVWLLALWVIPDGGQSQRNIVVGSSICHLLHTIHFTQMAWAEPIVAFDPRFCIHGHHVSEHE